MHPSNLQWLPAAENIAKHNHYDPADKEELMELVKRELALTAGI